MEKTRREFLLTAAIAPALKYIAGPLVLETDAPLHHLIPADKKLSPEWLKSLYEKGSTRIYKGNELRTIAMPIGGIAAGQVYLTGDGRLAHWDIFNFTKDTGPGDKCYVTGREPEFPIKQGFSLRANGMRKTLDRQGFPDLTFVGEYAIGTITYDQKDFPIKATMHAYSPFIPLNAEDSALPATILKFTLENKRDQPITAALDGELENAVLHQTGVYHSYKSVDTPRTEEKLFFIESSVQEIQEQAGREKIVFADFEGDDYGNWKIEGMAFGTHPSRGTNPPQQPVSGFAGKGLVNSYSGTDDTTGKLTSPTFTINRNYITFLIGGGAHPGKTCMNLMVDEKIVRTATGKNNERLEQSFWDVKEFAGKRARIEIVDAQKGGWGHINVDQIEFADRPTAARPLHEEPDYGTMGIGVLSSAGFQPVTADINEPVVRASIKLDLPPRSKNSVTFLITWHFPNRPVSGQCYANKFSSAFDVAHYIAKNIDRLERETFLWHDTYYDSTLPHWLLDRIHMPVSTLATGTCQWWKNGRFWAWEGVGCCHGTCTHVWNYEQAAARLFPQLERSAREMQDFGAGFHADSGLVGFRGGSEYAADGQCGTILKAYREHLFSKDDQFLKRNYEKIKKAIQFLIAHDQSSPRSSDRAYDIPTPKSEPDGLIEDPQHNTYDIWFHGPNTFVGSLYLAALRAMSKMAKLMNDDAFATKCEKIADSGSALTDKLLFDGEYYFQKVSLKEHPQFQYDHGCLSDQLFGQNWAHQLNLGYIYKKENVRTALKSIYKYNWTPDVGPYNEVHPPQRWFARAGDAGLITCTFPKTKYLGQGVLYREEVWTGIEYQVASHMLAEGMIDEALTIIRGIHDRYDAAHHNPWNEIECGDHYARAMASWACLTAISGFHYDGPAGKLSFNPKLTPENFRCAFTTATGWGTYTQTKSFAQIEIKYGNLALTEFTTPITGLLAVNGEKASLPATLKAGDKLAVAS